MLTCNGAESDIFSLITNYLLSTSHSSSTKRISGIVNMFLWSYNPINLANNISKVTVPAAFYEGVAFQYQVNQDGCKFQTWSF